MSDVIEQIEEVFINKYKLDPVKFSSHLEDKISEHKIIKEREEIEQNGEMLVGKFKNESGWYFKGKKMSKNQVKEEDGEDSRVYKNMNANRYDYIIKTEFGQAIPLERKDVVL